MPEPVYQRESAYRLWSTLTARTFSPHLDFSLVDSKAKKRIVKLYKQLEEELENSKKYIGSVQTDYVYQHKLHKTTIDKIDILIGRLFYLNDDEINEIINYQLAYRLNTERK